MTPADIALLIGGPLLILRFLSEVHRPGELLLHRRVPFPFSPPSSASPPSSYRPSGQIRLFRKAQSGFRRTIKMYMHQMGMVSTAEGKNSKRWLQSSTPRKSSPWL